MKKKEPSTVKAEVLEGAEGAETEEVSPLATEAMSLNQINQALVLRSKGSSLRDISLKLGVSEASIGRLLKGVSQEGAKKLLGSTSLPSGSKLTEMELGQFDPSLFQQTLYGVLLNNMRFSAWWRSLPEDIKNLVRPTQQHNGTQRPSEASIISDADVRRIVLLNFALKPQGANVTPQSAEAEVQKVLGIFKSLRDLETGAVESRKELESQIRESMKGEKSTIEKVAEAAKVITQEVKPVIETVVKTISPQPHAIPPPELPLPTPELEQASLTPEELPETEAYNPEKSVSFEPPKKSEKPETTKKGGEK